MFYYNKTAVCNTDIFGVSEMQLISRVTCLPHAEKCVSKHFCCFLRKFFLQNDNKQWGRRVVKKRVIFWKIIVWEGTVRMRISSWRELSRGNCQRINWSNTIQIDLSACLLYTYSLNNISYKQQKASLNDKLQIFITLTLCFKFDQLYNFFLSVFNKFTYICEEDLVDWSFFPKITSWFYNIGRIGYQCPFVTEVVSTVGNS